MNLEIGKLIMLEKLDKLIESKKDNDYLFYIEGRGLITVFADDSEKAKEILINKLIDERKK
jgi:hypothetical protein